MRYIGAAYLTYLGIRLLLSGAAFDQVRAKSTGPRRALLEGILVEALNVKTALFFLAFLPQFVPSGPSVVVQLVVLGSVCVVLNSWSMSLRFSAPRGCSGRRRPGGSARVC